MLCLSCLLWAGASRAVADETFRTDINPALLYFQGFMLAPNASDPAYQYFVTNNWYGQGQHLPDQFGELVAHYDTEMKYLHRASLQKYPCDWGIDMSPGPETLLPELAWCKKAAIAAQLHVLWQVQQGDEDAACQDILATLALGRNSSRDGTLIAGLVEIAIENITCSMVAENFGHFSPATLQKLADGFASAPERGTIADSFVTERFTAGHWLRSRIEQYQIEHPGDDAAVMGELRNLIVRMNYDSETNYWDKLTNAAGGTVEGLIKMTQQSELFAERLSHIVTLPHGEFERKYQQYSDDVKKSGNYLTADALDAWPNSRRKEFTVQAELAMVQAAVAYKLRGDDGLKLVPDPFGNGPFTMERFVFEGQDRGFRLTSAYSYIPKTGPAANTPVPVTMVFIEKDGKPVFVNGVKAGQAAPP